jgi:hypothetical protein
MKQHEFVAHSLPLWPGYLNTSNSLPPPLPTKYAQSQSIPAPLFPFPQQSQVNQSIYLMQQQHFQQQQSFHDSQKPFSDPNSNYSFCDYYAPQPETLIHSLQYANSQAFGDSIEAKGPSNSMTLVDFLDSINAAKEPGNSKRVKRTESEDGNENCAELKLKPNGEFNTLVEENNLRLELSNSNMVKNGILSNDGANSSTSNNDVGNFSNNSTCLGNIGSTLFPLNRPSENSGNEFDDSNVKFHQFSQFSSVFVRDLPLDDGPVEKEGREDEGIENQCSESRLKPYVSECDFAPTKQEMSLDELFAFPSTLGKASPTQPLIDGGETNATICHVCCEKEMKYKYEVFFFFFFFYLSV